MRLRPQTLRRSEFDKSLEYNEMVCVDGLQRITAILKFINNEIKAFEHYCKDIDYRALYNCDIQFEINNLKTEKEVLQWYVDLNSGGTIHTDAEINKVKNMIKQLKGEEK